MSGPFADSQLAAFVAQPGPAFADLDVPAMRAGIAQRAQSRTPGPAMDLVIDLTVGDRRARLYRPTSTALPVVLYLHGGGWTIGSLQSHDRLCRRLAAGSGAAVLALDYRLAPEQPWPASVEDCSTAFHRAALGHFDHAGRPTIASATGRHGARPGWGGDPDRSRSA